MYVCRVRAPELTKHSLEFLMMAALGCLHNMGDFPVQLRDFKISDALPCKVHNYSKHQLKTAANQLIFIC